MTKKKQAMGFKVFLLVGTVSRLVLAPFTMYEFDIGVLKLATRGFFERGIIVLFTEWTNPPLLYYITILSYSGYYLLHYKLGVPDFYPFAHSVQALEVFFLKLPFIIADILIFVFLNKSMSLLDIGKKKRLSLSSIYFLSPYIIFVSAAHGMWDSLSALFLVVGTYFIIKWQKREKSHALYLAILSFVASFGVKYVGLAPLFVVFSLLLVKKSYTQLAKGILVSLGSLLLLYLPFLLSGVNYLLNVFLFRLTGGQGLAYSANHFQLLYFLGVSQQIIKTLFLLSYLVFCFLLFTFIFYIVHKRQEGSSKASASLILPVYIMSTLLMVNIFYLCYYAVNIQLFVWYMALAPLFIAIVEMENEVENRFRFYVVLFSFLAGVFSILVNGSTILFGNPRPSPELANRGITGLLASFSAVAMSMYFAYMCYLVVKPFFPLGSSNTPRK